MKQILAIVLSLVLAGCAGLYFDYHIAAPCEGMVDAGPSVKTVEWKYVDTRHAMLKGCDAAGFEGAGTAGACYRVAGDVGYIYVMTEAMRPYKPFQDAGNISALIEHEEYCHLGKGNPTGRRYKHPY